MGYTYGFQHRDSYAFNAAVNPLPGTAPGYPGVPGYPGYPRVPTWGTRVPGPLCEPSRTTPVRTGRSRKSRTPKCPQASAQKQAPRSPAMSAT
eukprot:3935271-Rhodomonas_salina.1